MARLPCLDSTFSPIQPAPHLSSGCPWDMGHPVGSCPARGTGRLCHFVLHVGQVKYFATHAEPGPASLFPSPCFSPVLKAPSCLWLQCIVLDLVLKNGTLHPASQIPHDDKCSLACLKKQQNPANVKDLFSSCLQLSTNNTEISGVSETCLLYHPRPPGASAGRDPHEISLPNRFFCFLF